MFVWWNELEVEYFFIVVFIELVCYDYFIVLDDYGFCYVVVYLIDEVLEFLGEMVYIEVCLCVCEG